MLRPVDPRLLTVLAFLAFISLGLPDTLLGVAWPALRQTFRRPISDLGLLMACTAAGYLISSFLGGEIVRRVGVGRLLVGSTALVFLALAGDAASPAWLALLPFAFISGLGAGAIDAGINLFVAQRFSPRVVNWLHACWGIGASTGPLVMTAVLADGRSWRIGYAIAACVMAGMFVLFFRTADAWRLEPATTAAEDPPAASIRAALRRPIVLAQMAFYLLYGSIEASAGAWTFTLLAESRGLSIATAGTAVGAYWASITVGRIVFGQISTRVRPAVVLRIGLIGAVVAAALLLEAVPLAGNLVGIALLGLMLAPLFPTIIADTPRRVGAAYAAHAVGFQVAACAVGIAGGPWLAGLAARSKGVEVLPTWLVGACAALCILHEAIARVVDRRASAAVVGVD